MQEQSKAKSKLFVLTLAALGVVYGDIGTSPLYAINQIAFGQGGTVLTKANVIGFISLVVYSLTIVVAIKYVVFVLRANNDGEGGVFALYAILSDYRKKFGKWLIPVTLGMLMLAGGLLFGDGLITPAISVLSAVEGLSVAAASLHQYILPITISLLLILFFFQYKGTSKVGKIFGPIIIVWFLAIGLLGLRQVILHPSVSAALNPYYALHFLTHTHFTHLLVVIGFVMLSVTGGEALYADMGHFGKEPIRLGWFGLVYPALILNYLGQGAYLLGGGPVAQGNVFYSLVPSALLFPMIILATLATIIASQALISGAFSLVSQASALDIMPLVHKSYTDLHQEGQIYVPFVNWALCIGCLFLVVVFRTSDSLASAYGLAVSGVMLATSLAMILVAQLYWHWKPWQVYALFVPFAIIDASFFISNSFKFLQGGFIPFMVGFGVWGLMATWQWGRNEVNKQYDELRTFMVKDILSRGSDSYTSLPKTIIFMTRKFISTQDEVVPIAFQIFWNRFNIIPKNLLFLNVKIEKVPHMHERRFEIHQFESPQGVKVTSVRVNFGYWEETDVEKFLHELASHNKIQITEDPSQWLFYIIQHRPVLSSKASGFVSKLRFRVFNFLSKNSDTPDHYFGLGKDVGLSTETLPVYLE